MHHQILGSNIFTGPNNLPIASFPVLATGMQFTPGAISPVSIGQGGVATITGPGVFSDYYSSADFPATNFQLVIPGANVNAPIQVPLDSLVHSDVPPPALNYVVIGEWAADNQFSPPAAQKAPVIEYVFGYETPSSAMPATGQSSFTGTAYGWVYAPVDGHVMQAHLEGQAAFLANFASGNVTGAFTGMAYSAGGTATTVATGPWNDVSLAATIAAASNRFSGSAAVTSQPSSPYSLSISATGHIDGAFFGPSAQNLGAVWTLSDGTAAVIGRVSAVSPH